MARLVLDHDGRDNLSFLEILVRMAVRVCCATSDTSRGLGTGAATILLTKVVQILIGAVRSPMSDVKFTVGGAFEEEASRRFIDAWHRAERGETFHDRHFAFESWRALARVLTGKWKDLLSFFRC